MKELSLHIMDIMQNSVVAGASLIELTVNEQPEKDVLEFTVTDNGCGMDKEMVERVIDPYTTGRTTRRVGLGIPLLKLAAENAGGGIVLESEVGAGTKISARFGYNHIDRQPLGDMSQTMHQLITAHENIDFLYVHRVGEKSFEVDTRELKNVLAGVSFNTPEVMMWLMEFLKEGEAELYGID